VGRKQTEESKRGSKGGKKNRVREGSVAGEAREVDVRVTSLRKPRYEVKEKKKRQ
jgi:hypothetical protein